MAIEVYVPKEITEYEEKIILGMNKRRLLWTVIAAVLAIGSFVLCVYVFGLSIDAASYVVILVSLPPMAIGWIKKDNLPFEKLIALFLRHHIGNNKLTYVARPQITLEKEEERYARTQGKAISRAQYRKELRRKEGSVFAPTKKERKKKRKAARCETKAARKEYRTAKRHYKKERKKQSST